MVYFVVSRPFFLFLILWIRIPNVDESGSKSDPYSATQTLSLYSGYFTDFPMFIYAPVGNQLCRAESLFGRRGLWEAPFCKFNSVPRYLPSVKVHIPVFEVYKR